MNRETFLKSIAEDWEFTDEELLDEIKRLLIRFQADPINGKRKDDARVFVLMVHLCERVNKLHGIQPL